MTRAASLEDLAPLLVLCRAGRLFEVQEWIRQGKPIALPEGARTRAPQKNPLRVAMESGFHSMVQILLEAGAPPSEGRYEALQDAVEQRRPDLASLLLRHGANVDDVSMRLVVEMWHPQMVELFLSHGASLVRDKPIAWGLIHRMRPTLGLLQRSCAQQPDLMRQADLALRFHAGEGHAKGVALLLWAGADPWARGPDQLDVGNNDDDADDDDEGSFMNAIELAVFQGHVEILRQKKLLTSLDKARADEVRLLETALHAPDSLSLLLERGYDPKLIPDGGTRAIHSLLSSMSWGFSPLRLGTSFDTRSPSIDTDRSRQRLKMLHMLVAAGATWLPADKRAIGEARRCLLKMTPAYVLEFVWIMQAYGAARRRDVDELLRSAAMERLLSQEREKAADLAARVPDELPSECDLNS